jgi:hypothetical protein
MFGVMTAVLITGSFACLLFGAGALVVSSMNSNNATLVPEASTAPYHAPFGTPSAYPVPVPTGSLTPPPIAVEPGCQTTADSAAYPVTYPYRDDVQYFAAPVTHHEAAADEASEPSPVATSGDAPAKEDNLEEEPSEAEAS